ncbi:alpha/beta fold hydrolase [Pseudomonas kairouanensis]|uniref:Alpha/beta fold hydrolase n=1 Tax=Pseudomonas kairouanensis TaxID=2293832 RepID=A0A4Z0AWL1_9PSED|nr:alpha/beta fold hydrolase [Pseudomonas kairouanensis]TFY91186.1 alpha/beta fold hydrolase [Pseudomonas kairouanensis]
MSNQPLTDFNVQGRPKTLAEVKLWMKDRLQKRVHPLNMLDSDEGPLLIDSLTGLDGAAWAAVWLKAGNTVVEQAKGAEASGDKELASALYMKASGLYFLGRFPCPNHPDKERCAGLERETYLAASRSWKEPIRRIAIPFAGRSDEGTEVIGYLRKPVGIKSPPLVIMWGGVDAWKEQMTAACNAFLAKGVATLALDNAGTGESPVKGVVDAERQFLAALDWAAEQEDLQGDRVALLGRSFGGYWATKLAHTAASKIAAAVNWGGGAHYMFERSWVEASRYPDSYLMELVETRCRMLGATSDEEYIAGFKQLSLLDQGLLDLPSAPLLLVNGKHDRQCPIEDIQLLLDHGSPKSVRLFPGGHMGNTPQTLPTIVDWVVKHLGVTK